MKERPRILKVSQTYIKNGKRKNRNIAKIKMKGVSLSGKRLQITLKGNDISRSWAKEVFLLHLSRT